MRDETLAFTLAREHEITRTLLARIRLNISELRTLAAETRMVIEESQKAVFDAEEVLRQPTSNVAL